MKNKIKIPWYHRNIRIMQGEEMETNPINIQFPNFPKPGRNPIRELVREPVTEPVKEPVPTTVREPFPYLQPDTEANPFRVPNPFPEGFPFPTPFPLPNPKDNKQRFPTPNPIPQPVYTKDQQKWVDNFVKNIAITGAITGIATKQIYDYVANYDFKTYDLSQFRQDASNEFGQFAGTVLMVALIGKSLVQIWGKRATAIFAPPMILDDEFFEENFNKNRHEI